MRHENCMVHVLFVKMCQQHVRGDCVKHVHVRITQLCNTYTRTARNTVGGTCACLFCKIVSKNTFWENVCNYNMYQNVCVVLSQTLRHVLIYLWHASRKNMWISCLIWHWYLINRLGVSFSDIESDDLISRNLGLALHMAMLMCRRSPAIACS